MIHAGYEGEDFGEKYLVHNPRYLCNKRQKMYKSARRYV